MSQKIPTVIKRQLPNAVTYDLSSPGSVRITLPPASTWSSGLHWHESHTEYLKVVKGSARVRVGDAWQVITATGDEHPEVRVDRHVWHEWQRASPAGDEVVVVERTDPADGEKSIFFWNLNGVILNPPSFPWFGWAGSWLPRFVGSILREFWVTLNLFVIFHHLDNFPAFFDAVNALPIVGGLVNWAASHGILYLAAWIGWILGAQPVRRAYTPSDSYSRWWEMKNKNRASAKRK